MDKYELENRYYDEDEIDLAEILKTIIKEKKLIFIVTVIFTIFAAGFAFYKINQPKNYGVNITFSEETANKINQYNNIYKNGSLAFNGTVQKSFDTLLDNPENDIIVISSEKTKEIADAMKEDYDFIKIIDRKNKSYKLFTKTKDENIEKISAEINKIIDEDTKILNNEFKKNFADEIETSENTLAVLTKDTDKLNKEIMTVVNKNFSDVSKENMKANLSIIAPVLYVEYQEKINSLNSMYLKVADLKNIQKDAENLFSFSGEENITVISVDKPSSDRGISPKLIILIGVVLGVFAGMFFAVIKAPLKNIFKEIKEEK